MDNFNYKKLTDEARGLLSYWLDHNIKHHKMYLILGFILTFGGCSPIYMKLLNISILWLALLFLVLLILYWLVCIKPYIRYKRWKKAINSDNIEFCKVTCHSRISRFIGKRKRVSCILIDNEGTRIKTTHFDYLTSMPEVGNVCLIFKYINSYFICVYGDRLCIIHS